LQRIHFAIETLELGGNSLSIFSCFSSDIKRGHSSPTKEKKEQEKVVTVKTVTRPQSEISLLCMKEKFDREWTRKFKGLTY
jgi:hypothetical protein